MAHGEEYLNAVTETRRLTAMSRVGSAPFAMLREGFAAIMRQTEVIEIVEDDGPEEATIIEAVELETAYPDSAGPKLPKSKGSVAVLPVRGSIGQHRGADYWANVYSEDLSAQITRLAESPSIGAIVLDIDSPGGIVYGMPELAETVRGLRDSKPIIGLANGMAASAAFWLLASTTKAFATPSSEVGSHGVWTAHVDQSKALEQEGIDVTLVSAGEFKVEGHPFGPLTDEARDELQAGVDRYYGMFTDGLAKGRNVPAGVVKSDFGRGRMLGAADAKRAGMIDGIATLPELLGMMLPVQQNRQPGRRANAAKARLAMAQRISP